MVIPKTMRGKEWLKRIFYGKLKPIPAELRPETSELAPLERLIPPYQAGPYRFIHAIATLP